MFIKSRKQNSFSFSVFACHRYVFEQPTLLYLFSFLSSSYRGRKESTETIGSIYQFNHSFFLCWMFFNLVVFHLSWHHASLQGCHADEELDLLIKVLSKQSCKNTKNPKSFIPRKIEKISKFCFVEEIVFLLW